jgi:hypothetical protein
MPLMKSQRSCLVEVLLLQGRKESRTGSRSTVLAENAIA